MLKLSRSQNLILAGIIAGLEVEKHTSMSTWLQKTKLQSKIIVHFFMKNGITFIHANVQENLMSGRFIHGILSLC